MSQVLSYIWSASLTEGHSRYLHQLKTLYAKCYFTSKLIKIWCRQLFLKISRNMKTFSNHRYITWRKREGVSTTTSQKSSLSQEKSCRDRGGWCVRTSAFNSDNSVQLKSDCFNFYRMYFLLNSEQTAAHDFDKSDGNPTQNNSQNYFRRKWECFCQIIQFIIMWWLLSTFCNPLKMFYSCFTK